MRGSGILMHISSLPSNYGIGTFGEKAYEFVDFLEKSNQKYWQILPICPTSFGDSPYQSFSSFAGNPYFIDLDFLIQDFYLSKFDIDKINWGSDVARVDFNAIYTNRFKILKKAAKNFIPSQSYNDFVDKNDFWLDDYAFFMAIKDDNNGKAWYEWNEKLKLRDKNELQNFKENHINEIEFYKVIQYFFYTQWYKLKKYANEKNIKIIGDLPIYVAMDSVDVWANSKMFMLDKNCNPIKVAGCPPDAFSQDGQLWGNPLYDWNFMKNDDYSWWIKRIEYVSKIFDITRIDHFRGFDSFYAINWREKTARNGEWLKGPGIELFEKAKLKLGNLNIIAEDLGFLTESVQNLVKKTGFPGMKILQFAFDTREDSDYLPHNYIKNCVVYTGTHDNDTILGWFNSGNENDIKFAVDYMRLTENEGYNWGVIKTAWASVCDTVIIQMQDLLSLDNSARMNIPSTVGSNWQWRMENECINDELAQKINKYMTIYRRN